MDAPSQDWIERIIDQMVQHHICTVVLLEWFLPHDGGIVPVMRQGHPVISRVSFTPSGISEGNHTMEFHHKLWSLENRFDKRTVSDHPAMVRISLDYLVMSDSKLRVDVQSESRMFSPAKLAAMDPYETGAVSRFVVAQLVKALGGPEIDDADYMRFMNELNRRLRQRPYTPRLDSMARYLGRRSDWLDSRFESLVSDIRLAFGTDELWIHVDRLLSRLYMMLGTYHTRKHTDFRNALRPMVLPDNARTQLHPLPKLYDLKEPIDDVLFSWTTETLAAQAMGYVTLAPQTRYVWCTRQYMVLLDIRICRDDWYSGLLLPDLYLFVVDTSRELAYAVYMNQLPADGTVSASAALLEFVVPDMDRLLLMLALGNVRVSVPKLVQLEKLGDLESTDVGLSLPRWFDARVPALRAHVRRLSDVQRGSFRFRILPQSFEGRMREIIHAFLQAAYSGIRLRVNYDTNKHYLLQTKSPALLGFLSGINRVNGKGSFFPLKVYHHWMKRAFSNIQINPWHVLAWRFFDTAVTAGLTSRYARYLWRLDPVSMEIMFGWRTIAATAGPIPVVGDASALHPERSDRYEIWALINQIPMKHHGRVLDITPEDFEKHVIGFNEASFLTAWPAMKSMLELVISED